ncbi:hypothetical protein ACLESD_32730 [Pyxidicoccus sp. 3LFB2]
MPLLYLHVDRHLARLASSGSLPPRQWNRTLRHARGCARCGPRYERVMHMQRVLAHGTLAEPTPAELESVATRGLGAALASAAEGLTPARGGVGAWVRGLGASEDRSLVPSRGGVGEWVRGLGARLTSAIRGLLPAPEQPDAGGEITPWTGLGRAWVLAAVATYALLLFVMPREEEEWTRRGEGGTAVLRLFCVPEDSALHEVKGEGACPPGAALAFAAGGRTPLTHAVVVLRGADGTRVEGPFEVRSLPGAEAALDVTPRLPLSGEVEVTAFFAPTAQAALSAARGEPAEGIVRVQHRVRVESTP